jgi:hypothetical protein
MANGCPTSIHDQDSDTALPSESLLSPGDYTPMGYLASSVGLAQISGHIFQAMYSVPQQRSFPGPQTAGTHRISRRTIADLYGELVRWRHDVPPHLRITNPLSSPRSLSLTSASDIPSPQSPVRPCSVASPLSATEPSKAISGKSNIHNHLRRRLFPVRPLLLHGNLIWLLS